MNFCLLIWVTFYVIVEIQAIIPLKKNYSALSMESRKFRLLGTGSLAPANFSGAVFTCAHFQKIAQISLSYAFMQFSLYK